MTESQSCAKMRPAQQRERQIIAEDPQLDKSPLISVRASKLPPTSCIHIRIQKGENSGIRTLNGMTITSFKFTIYLF